MAAARIVDRYALHRELASGGMGAVRLGRLQGEAGFGRVVAVKTLHPHLAKDPEVVAMFVAEAKLAARIRHPNVVATLDVVSSTGDLLLVMEYVHGESLAALIRRSAAIKEPPSRSVVAAIATDALEGLHAAHQATNSRGVPLKIVHRDISPHNLILGVDGLTRVLDFGVARAVERSRSTGDASLKGKIGYIAPERLSTEPFDHRADLWSMGVVLWELLTQEKLFPAAESPAAAMVSILRDEIRMPGELGKDGAFDDVLRRALKRNPRERFESARQMSQAIEKMVAPAPPREVGRWVRRVAQEALAERQGWLEEMENGGDAQPELVVGELRAIGSVTPPPMSSATPGAPVSAGAVEMPVAVNVTATATQDHRATPKRRVLPTLLLVGATLAAVGAAAYFTGARGLGASAKLPTGNAEGLPPAPPSAASVETAPLVPLASGSGASGATGGASAHAGRPPWHRPVVPAPTQTGKATAAPADSLQHDRRQ